MYPVRKKCLGHDISAVRPALDGTDRMRQSVDLWARTCDSRSQTIQTTRFRSREYEYTREYGYSDIDSNG